MLARYMIVCAALALPSTLVSQAAVPAVHRLAGAEAADQVKPIKWIYVARLSAEGTMSRLGFRTLEMTPSTYNGTPAWLLVDSRQFNRVTLAESLYVTKSDLSPLRRVVHNADQQIVNEFTPDSIASSYEGKNGRATWSVANTPGLTPNLYLLEALLQVAPLSANWSSTATLIALGPTESGRVTADMRVDGDEKVLVPDGTFDCWTVSLKVGRSEQRLWIRKSDRVPIKETTPVVGMGGASVQLLLAVNGVR